MGRKTKRIRIENARVTDSRISANIPLDMLVKVLGDAARALSIHVVLHNTENGWVLSFGRIRRDANGRVQRDNNGNPVIIPRDVRPNWDLKPEKLSTGEFKTSVATAVGDILTKHFEFVPSSRASNIIPLSQILSGEETETATVDDIIP